MNIKYTEAQKDTLLNNYANSRSKNLIRYIGMIGTSYHSRIDLIGQLIGDAHEYSLGRYKENLIMKLIRENLPSRFEVGTGFIIFPHSEPITEEELETDWFDRETHAVSKELDLVVYNKTDYPPIYRDGDFVILRPESVRAIVGIKGYLTRSQIDESIASAVDTGRKWTKYYETVNAWGDGELNKPTLFLMGLAVKPDENGRPETDGQRLRTRIVRKYRELLTQEDLQSACFPLINVAAIYNECMVMAMHEVTPDQQWFGYYTVSGRFSRDDTFFDSTLAFLLAGIHQSLEINFNPLFSYFSASSYPFDQEYEHKGFERWLDYRAYQDTFLRYIRAQRLL